MSDTGIWDLFAIRYGRHAGRVRADNFIMPPDRHDAPMPIDYFVWAIVDGEPRHRRRYRLRPGEAARRRREVQRLPREGLAMARHRFARRRGRHRHSPALRPRGNHRRLPRCALPPPGPGDGLCDRPPHGAQAFGYAYSADHVKRLIDKLFEGRLAFHDGDSQVAPGVTTHRIGGHTMGMQCVRVRTRRGWVVLASDASHLYENMEATAPFPIAYSVADMVQGYETMRRLAESPAHIVPGHDPLVMERYPAAQGLEGVAVRLDAAPSA